MADYTKQIFDMLGVEPEEEFKITTHNPNYRNRYIFKFDKDLNLFTRTTNTKWDTALLCFLLEILTGKCDIVKIPRPTAEEQLAIDYARACGYKWVAKDENKKVFAFKNKPIKAEPQSKYNISRVGIWHDKGDEVGCMRIEIPISFLHWEDEEPYYIGD